MPSFSPRNPRFKRVVRDTFSSQSFLAMVGARLAYVKPGEVKIELPFKEHLLQHHGYLHGAVIAAVADTACGCAALTLMPPDSSVLTVEYKVSFLAPAAGGSLVAQGLVVKPGRRLTFCKGQASVINDLGERTVATLTATMIRVDAE